MNSVVIVESPAKSRTINKILGKDFIVTASIGHIKDLPKKELGVDIKNNFDPQYIVIPGKEKVIKELKQIAMKADRIYLATDHDREGEAIAWHIASEISNSKSKIPNEKIYRIIFNEITEKAVKEAIKHPERINMNKVDAQQARRILDRLVGYGLSPLLWRKVRRGLSAGRVQSVAVRLIVERERDISAFKKEEYWSINVRFEGSTPPEFWAKLSKLVQKSEAESGKFLVPDKSTADAVTEELKDKKFILKKIEKKLKKRTPYPPFITSTLQQAAARDLRFTAKRTMLVAQQLYEGVEIGKEGAVGLITYMRTDSFRVAQEAHEWARKFIEKTFGKDYLPEKPPLYKSKASAQEAHEAIRPTYANRTPEDVKQHLTKEQYALYTLIWNRFISSQMSPAQLEQTVFIIEAVKLNPIVSEKKGDGEFAELRASGTVIRFNGFMALYTESREEAADEDERILPSLKEGGKLRLLELQPKQHFTQPPPRYSEATLIKTLEEKGIGRPSTYAAILSTIQDRKYVQKDTGKFAPTELGVVVNDLLVDRFSDVLDIGFTASMEDKLDSIEEGKMKWVKVVKDFYKPFSRDLEDAKKTQQRVKPEDIPTDVKCEKCGKPMVIKWGRNGKFLACSGYPECKNTKNFVTEENGNIKVAEEKFETTDEKCPKCDSPMVLKSGRFGEFLACSKYPECKTTKAIATGIKCPEDGGDIVERRSKKGKVFWSCGNYPKCKFASWYKPVLKKCHQCNADFLFEKRLKGGAIILQCHKKDCGYKEEVNQLEESTA
ncbi:MAG TPA: type I DNA topoisomerase [Nitrospiraceae bacterium]|nr:type I DNA topoisomerase [Nitrospiraceae bacterium]